MTTASPLPDWKVFITNPKAKKVVEMALANNRDLRVAVLNIEKARAAYGIQRSALMPSVAAGLQENAGKNAEHYVGHGQQLCLPYVSGKPGFYGLGAGSVRASQKLERSRSSAVLLS